MSTSTRWAREAAMVCRRAPNAKTITVGSVSAVGPVQEEDRVLQDASGADTLRRVTVEDAANAGLTFEMLMGNEVAPRRDFIVAGAARLERERIDA